MKGRSKTKADEKLHDDLREMGCSVCRFVYNRYDLATPAIHHIEGKTKENAHSLVISLCNTHHQYGTKNDPSIHANGSHGGKYQFKMVHGVTEYDLLELSEAYLDRPYSSENDKGG